LTRVKDAGIETVLLDTLSDDCIQNCVAQIREMTGGSLDALLNNAGAGYSMPLMDVNIAKARELFDLNVWSILNVTRAFLPLLMKSTNESGVLVVNNTACASVKAGMTPFSGAYNASKAVAGRLTETLRLELELFGIKVVNLMTGAVRSTFHDNAPTPVLPSTSLYNVAKETVEKAMSGADAATNGADPEEWASQVVGDLGKPNAPFWIWRGKFSKIVRLVSHLPVGDLDGSMKNMVGLDVVEKEYTKQHGSVEEESG
jgi:NAD(P)-dependent dehydrogenase (short-subunit alcohol dehydrogenase family)